MDEMQAQDTKPLRGDSKYGKGRLPLTWLPSFALAIHSCTKAYYLGSNSSGSLAWLV